jgi:hypothetical protein
MWKPNGNFSPKHLYNPSSMNSIKVIILPNVNDTNTKSDKKFTAMKLKTKGFKFNREEANER